MLESTMHNRVEAGCSVMASSVPKHFLCSAADDILRLTNNFSDFVLPSSLAEEVTVVDTVSGPMVWCTFKNFLSVTFMFSVLGSCTSDAMANWHDHSRRNNFGWRRFLIYNNRERVSWEGKQSRSLGSRRIMKFTRGGGGSLVNPSHTYGTLAKLRYFSGSSSRLYDSWESTVCLTWYFLRGAAEERRPTTSNTSTARRRSAALTTTSYFAVCVAQLRTRHCLAVKQQRCCCSSPRSFLLWCCGIEWNVENWDESSPPKKIQQRPFLLLKKEVTTWFNYHTERSFPFHTFNFFPLTSLLDVAFAFPPVFPAVWMNTKAWKSLLVIYWKQPSE